MESVDSERYPDVGKPEYFGRAVRMTRVYYGVELDAWASAIDVEPHYLSEVEYGRQPVPTQKTITEWGKSWQLAEEDVDNLLACAGHIPFKITTLSFEEIAVLKERSPREVQPKSFMEELKDRLNVSIVLAKIFLSRPK